MLDFLRKIFPFFFKEKAESKPIEAKPVTPVKIEEPKPQEKPLESIPVEGGVVLRPYDYAKKELGVKEVSGSKHNDRILQYHKTVAGKPSTDEVAWCSSFMNWCHIQAGLKGTNKANARSWLNEWSEGQVVTEPKEGDVVIFWRNDKNGWEGHVAFFVRFEGSNVICLGGNQANKVCLDDYPKSRVLGYRRSKSL